MALMYMTSFLIRSKCSYFYQVSYSLMIDLREGLLALNYAAIIKLTYLRPYATFSPKAYISF